MISIESTSKEKLAELPVGTRLYVVQFFDGTDVNACATALEPDDLVRLDAACEESEVPFAVGLEMAAVKHLIHLLWKGEEPDEFEVHSVVEVSQRELCAMMDRTAERLAEREVS